MVVDDRRPIIINAFQNNGSSMPGRSNTLTRPSRQPTLRRTLMRDDTRPPPAARAGKNFFFIYIKFNKLVIFINNYIYIKIFKIKNKIFKYLIINIQ